MKKVKFEVIINNPEYEKYRNCIEDLLENSDIQKLNHFKQHINTCRLQHCINVSYNSYFLCEKFNLDYKSVARAGILHDFFLYYWKEEKHTPINHNYKHPIVAYNNSKAITQINILEENAILSHMWPFCITKPKYAESFVMSFVDKYCATFEVFQALYAKFRQTYAKFRQAYAN